jgi:hypothetical protein
MNSQQFLANPKTYFSTSYKQFCAFGGPCVYFHRECLRAGKEAFASHRHIEMLYATLTAWGMHRMGDVGKTKTKLTGWDQFRKSLERSADMVRPLRGMKLTGMSEKDYADVVSGLRKAYEALRLSESDATIVVNAKALYHLLPDLIPPIDRQYTIRFFRQPPEKWLKIRPNGKAKFTLISLPKGAEKQFRLFQEICGKVKRLADRLDGALLDKELTDNDVTAPKAIDNAIVNYVRMVSKIPVADHDE